MLSAKSRRTHVIWSFENQCLNDDLIDVIKDEDVDAIRLVSEKGEVTPLFQFAGKLNKALSGTDKTLPVMIDLFSKVRGFITELKEQRELQFGEKVTFSAAGGKGDFQVRTDSLKELFSNEVPVYLGNGSVVLSPTSVTDDLVTLEVVQGGTVFPDMEVHVPGTRKAPRFTDLSAEAMREVFANTVDYLVVPTFDTPEDLEKLQKTLQEGKEYPPWLILRVNSEKSYKRLKDFLPYVRGVLISRVELAMTMDPAQVPMLTKEIIQLCNDRAKIVLVASEILGSMRHNATPTRAEVSDIANAVLDGADGVILSEDLPYGDYARRGLMLARRAVEDVEQTEGASQLNWIKHTPQVNDELDAITYSAYRTAQRNKAKAIVCITKHGNTALLLASFRTAIPIVAVTLSPEVSRQLALVRGVSGMVLKDAPNIEEVLPIVNDRLVNESWLKAGDKIAFVSVTLSSIAKTASNLFTIQTLR